MSSSNSPTGSWRAHPWFLSAFSSMGACSFANGPKVRLRVDVFAFHYGSVTYWTRFFLSVNVSLHSNLMNLDVHDQGAKSSNSFQKTPTSPTSPTPHHTRRRRDGSERGVQMLQRHEWREAQASRETPKSAGVRPGRRSGRLNRRRRRRRRRRSSSSLDFGTMQTHL